MIKKSLYGDKSDGQRLDRCCHLSSNNETLEETALDNTGYPIEDDIKNETLIGKHKELNEFNKGAIPKVMKKKKMKRKKLETSKKHEKSLQNKFEVEVQLDEKLDERKLDVMNVPMLKDEYKG